LAPETLLDESLAAAEAMDEPWACARTLLFAGWVPWTRGDHDAAEKVWRRALDVEWGRRLPSHSPPS